MIFMPSRLTSDYWFEKAEQCFRRSRAGSNVRVELEAQGNVFMVNAVQLDIKLQLPKATTPPLPRASVTTMDKLHFDRTDYSVVVKNMAPLPNSWKWEIYRAGRSSPIKQSSSIFTPW